MGQSKPLADNQKSVLLRPGMVLLSADSIALAEGEPAAKLVLTAPEGHVPWVEWDARPRKAGEPVVGVVTSRRRA